MEAACGPRGPLRRVRTRGLWRRRAARGASHGGAAATACGARGCGNGMRRGAAAACGRSSAATCLMLILIFLVEGETPKLRWGKENELPMNGGKSRFHRRSCSGSRGLQGVPICCLVSTCQEIFTSLTPTSLPLMKFHLHRLLSQGLHRLLHLAKLVFYPKAVLIWIIRIIQCLISFFSDVYNQLFEKYISNN